jgi:hypothetical protein
MKPLKVSSFFPANKGSHADILFQAPKKEKKEETEEDKALKEKAKKDAAALKEAKEKGAPCCSRWLSRTYPWHGRQL